MAARKVCKAKVGGRTGRPCGEPVADGMLACCRAHRTVMVPTATPGIYARGSRYVVVWEHRGRQHKKSYRTLAEAREAKGRRQAGDRKPATRQLFEDYAIAWIAGYTGRTSRGFTEDARREYRRALELHIVPFFAGWKFSDVEPRDVRRLVRRLEEEAGLAPASVVKVLTPLKAMFATAVEDGDLASNPGAGVRVNARRDEGDEEPEPKAMTHDELGRVLAHMPAEWLLFFELLAKMGLRISEALGLDWSDVEFGARPVLHVRRQFYRGTLRQLKTSNGKRDLPLPAGLARRLWAARPAGANGPVFATSTGTRFSDRNVRRVLDRATGHEAERLARKAIKAGRPIPSPGDHAGVPSIGFHTFRHTCASMLFDAGKNVRQVADWLGHSDPAFTLRTYVHLMDGGLGDANFLDEAVPAAEGGKAVAREHPETAASDRARAASETAG
jgi:integrase